MYYNRGGSTIVYQIPKFKELGKLNHTHNANLFQNESTSPAATGYNSGPRSARNKGVG